MLDACITASTESTIVLDILMATSGLAAAYVIR